MTRILPGTIALALLLCSVDPSVAQNIESWDILSALDRTNAVLVTKDGRRIVGTTGGAYEMANADVIDRVWRSNGELTDLSVTAVGEDPENGDLYFGSISGAISILHQGGSWTYVGDLSRVDNPDRQITGFRFFGGDVFVLTSFGVSLYSRQDSTFRDSWTRLGAFQSDTRVNDLLVVGDSVFVATSAGLAVSSRRGSVLADPLSWRAYPVGECAGEIVSMVVTNDKILLGGPSGLCAYENGNLSPIASTPASLYLAATNGRIVGVAGTDIYDLTDGTARKAGSISRPGTSISLDDNGVILVGTDRGAVWIDGDSVLEILPDGPASNSFLDLAVDGASALWVASGNKGASRLLQDKWTNYTSQTSEIIESDGIRTLSSDHTGRVWGGSFGDGFYRFTPNGADVIIDHFDESNTPLQGISSSPEFTVTESVASDDRGVVWGLNWDNTDGRRNALYSYEYGSGESAGIWTPHPFSGRFFNYTKTFRWIEVDLNGTKWIAGNDKPQGLLYYVNEENDPSRPGIWNALTTSHGLPQNDPTSLLVDPDGEIWIGTPAGVAILVNPFGVRQDGPGAAIFREVPSLDGVFIWDIATDALKRKWIGTDQGVFLLTADGTELLAHYTERNSPLSNNVVRSVVSDTRSGYVYLGTENGLNRLATEAIDVVEIAEISVSPQPYLPGPDDFAKLKGLPRNATIKILTTDGRLVREYLSPGGAVASWDGTDAEGNLVPTGIYVILAASPLGDKATGKIAVVRL